MLKGTRGRCRALGAAWLLPVFLQAQFQALETKQQRLLVFGEAHSYLVPHVARTVELTMDRYRALFGWEPSEPVTILLHDFKDRGNASAGSVPTNRIIVVISPFSYGFETTPGNERMGWLMSHEMVHVLASDGATPSDRRARAFFGGKVYPDAQAPLSILYGYLTNPRDYAPRWYHEGIATFMETWSSGGLGRTLGAYDEMVFRSLVKEGVPIRDHVSLESEGVRTDFQGGMNSYLYGTRFFSYLARMHGPEKALEWVARRPGSRAYYADQFQQVFQRSLSEAWEAWRLEETSWQEQNLVRIRQHPVTLGRPVPTRPLGSVSRAFVDPVTKEILLGVHYPGQVAHLAAIHPDTGEVRRLESIKGPILLEVTSLAFDPGARTLFYTSDNGDLRDLMALDLATGKSRVLLEDGRIGDLVFHPLDRSLWGVRHYNGISTLVRIPHPYREWNQIHSFPYGQDLYSLDLSPDGKTLSGALTEISGRQQLVLMDTGLLLKGQSSWTSMPDFDFSSPSGFVFSPDGRYLYGSSYYSGVSNLYRVDLGTRKIQPITNVETGIFRPVPLADGSLLAFRYGAGGFQPEWLKPEPVAEVASIRFAGQEIVDRHPVVKSWVAPPPSSLDLASRVTYEGSYEELAHLRLRNLYPILEGYKDSVAGGLRMLLASPLDFHRVDVTASFSPDRKLPREERLHFQANYSYLEWKLKAKYNAGDFYDLFGPTKTGRKGYSLGGEYKKYLIFDEPGRFMDLTFDLTGYGGLDTLPGNQNVHLAFDRLFSFSGRWSYRFLEKSLGAVDDERGYHLEVVGGAEHAHSGLVPRLYASALKGFSLPMGHSSLWLQAASGQAWGEADNPLANFYFGAFGNNWVDHQEERRFRRVTSFPGVEIGAVGGRSFGKAMVELDLPALVFGAWGSPSFYLNWARLSFFAMGLRLRGGAEGQTLRNVGCQMDLRVLALTHHSLTLSIGWARAFLGGGRRNDEAMVSMKIL